MRGMVEAVPRFDVRPSKPYAVFMALGALAILIFGTVQVFLHDAFEWPFLLFLAAGLFIIVAVLTHAFRGDTATARTGSSAEPADGRIARNRTLAVVGAIAGVGILIFGGFMLAGKESPLEIALFSVAGLAIIGFNLWSAFSRNGGRYAVTRRD